VTYPSKISKRFVVTQQNKPQTMAKTSKKKNTLKPKHTLKTSQHAATRSNKNKESEIEINEEEDERMNEDIVVVINTPKKW